MDDDKGDGQSISNDRTVQAIVSMGYPEQDVRRAVRASFGNPERAIEYLIDGIPESPSAPEGDKSDSDTSRSSGLSPDQYLRNDPRIRRLRRTVLRNPQIANNIFSHVGSLNPFLLRFVNQHPQEFLRVLAEPLEDDEKDSDEGVGSDTDFGEAN